LEHGYGRITSQIVEEIRGIIEEKRLIFDDLDILENYAADEAGKRFRHVPEVVVKPESREEVSRLMALAHRHKIPVTPRGAGSASSGAAVPLHGGMVLSLERMNKILEIDKVNRVAVVEPGVVTKELCAKVLDAGLMYAGYPMSVDASFIGGNVATNAGGGKVVKYGNTRMHVLGLEVVLANGEVIQIGGKYRKETWGYNLLHLMIGSEGTLGVFTKIMVNLVPSAGKTVDLLIPFGDVKAAVSAVAELIVSGGILPVGVEFLDKLSVEISTKYLDSTIPFQDKSEAYLIVQLEGESNEQLVALYEKAGDICINSGALDVFVADSRTESENIWKVRQVFADALRATDPHAILGGDVVVPLSKVPELMQQIREIGEKYHVMVPTVAHIADGNIHPELMKPRDLSPKEFPAVSIDVYDEMTLAAVRLGGVGSGEHGIGLLKKGIFLKTKSETELTLMRGIKRVFDPHNILNPGKMM
jgi:glycolate oxidase